MVSTCAPPRSLRASPWSKIDNTRSSSSRRRPRSRGILRREGAEALEERHRGVREAHRAASRGAQRNLEFVLRTAAETPDPPPGRTPAEAVMQVLGASVSVEIRPSAPAQPSGGPAEPDDPLGPTSRSPADRRPGPRRITLAPKWWKRDGPSFAGTTGPDGQPIAILKDGRRGFRAVDPSTGRSFRIGRREARDIASEGVMLYAPFPDGVRTVTGALGDVADSVTGEIRSVLLMSLLSTLVGLAAPVLTGHLPATVIPRSDTPMWIAGLTAMFLCAVGGAVFQLGQAFALLRIFQMITGPSMLRVANAEPFVLGHWAGLFARQRRETFRARRWAAAQLAFNGLFTPVAQTVLLAAIWGFLIAGGESASLGLAEFLIAFAAFGQLAGA